MTNKKRNAILYKPQPAGYPTTEGTIVCIRSLRSFVNSLTPVIYNITHQMHIKAQLHCKVIL